MCDLKLKVLKFTWGVKCEFLTTLLIIFWNKLLWVTLNFPAVENFFQSRLDRVYLSNSYYAETKRKAKNKSNGRQKVKRCDNNGLFWTHNTDLVFIKSGRNPAAQKLGGLTYNGTAIEAGVYKQCQLVLMKKLQLSAHRKLNYCLNLPNAFEFQRSLGSHPDLNWATKPISFKWHLRNCQGLEGNTPQNLSIGAQHFEIQNI